MEDTRKTSIKAAQGLFLLNMLIWLGFGTASLARLEKGGDPVYVVIALMLLGNAVLMGVAAWLLGKHTLWGYLFALVLLGINILTTFTDQVGLPDIATVLVDIVLFLLLIFKRREFISAVEQAG